jgi:Uma2 family endonuclease
VERHPGEHDQNLLQHLLSLELGRRARERRFRVFVEQRVRITDEPRYRIPDVCVKALPYHNTPVLVQPDLAIEIVSPDDAPVEMLEKVADATRPGFLTSASSMPAGAQSSGPIARQCARPPY